MSIEEAIGILKKVNEKYIGGESINVEQLEAIETILKEVERLTWARNWYFRHYTARMTTPEQLHKILSFEYVSRDKMKETVSKLQDMEKTSEHKSKISYAIGILQEILESEE